MIRLRILGLALVTCVAANGAAVAEKQDFDATAIHELPKPPAKPFKGEVVGMEPHYDPARARKAPRPGVVTVLILPRIEPDTRNTNWGGQNEKWMRSGSGTWHGPRPGKATLKTR